LSDQRLHPLVELDEAQVEDLIRPYGLHSESYSVLSGGLINTNLKVATAQGPILLRLYVSERSVDEVSFEMSVLEQLAQSGLSVQRPRRTTDDELFRTDAAGRQYAVLEFIPGVPMAEDALSDEIAADIGRFIAGMQESLRGFKPRGAKPTADLDFIERELAALRAQEDGFAAVQDLWPDARHHFDSGTFAQGVVHADIYPGNVIVDDAGSLRAVIDFDDCYWGTTAFDVAIATMAFSFTGATTPDWRRAMVTVNAYLAAGGEISAEDVYQGMVVNCVRFYVYTLPLTVGAGDSADVNPFAQRARLLGDPTVKQDFLHAWQDARPTGR
jgi:Ser/Thr protein kinase RdoA (MazF antagonist)